MICVQFSSLSESLKVYVNPCQFHGNSSVGDCKLPSSSRYQPLACICLCPQEQSGPRRQKSRSILFVMRQVPFRKGLWKKSRWWFPIFFMFTPILNSTIIFSDEWFNHQPEKVDVSSMAVISTCSPGQQRKEFYLREAKSSW